MKEQKGLTLIECLISMLILAILLSAGMAFYFYAQAGFRWSVHKRIAIEMASAEMESIKNSGYDTLPDPAPPGVWRTSSVNIGNLTGTREVYLYDITGYRYKRVRVVIAWQDPGKSASQSVSLDTYIATLQVDPCNNGCG